MTNVQPTTPPSTGRRMLTRTMMLVSIVGAAIALIVGSTKLVDAATSTVALLALLVVLDVFSDRLSIRLRFGAHEAELTAGAVSLVAAIVLLPPTIAPLVLVGSIGAAIVQGAWFRCLDFGLYVSATALSAHGVSTLVGVVPDQVETLPRAFVAALLLELAALVLIGLFVAGIGPGLGLAYVREGLLVSAFNVVLPSILVAVAAPFAPWPVALVAILALLQMVTFMGLRVLRSEQLHRDKSTFLRSTLSRYVSEGVVEEIEARGSELELGGELCELTVLFLDVRDFTSWSEQLAPREVLDQLNELLDTMTEAVLANGGTLDKFTGDGMMAFWGAPVPVDDHAERACRAALSMLERLDVTNAARADRGQPDLQVGIGVHTGVALVGNVGHERRLDYTAIGDTVNTASRLESATRESGASILVSGATRAALAADDWDPHLSNVGEIHVKGRRETVVAWRIDPVEPADTQAA